MLRGIIFDVDGTLVASNEAHARSWVEVFAEAGYDVPFGVVWPMIGMGGDKLLPAAVGIDEDSIQGKELGKRRWGIFRAKYLPHLSPTPGARALVERMKADGFQLVVASSAGGSELGALMEAAGIADLIPTATSSSDAADSKPDPDIVEAAVRKTGFDPSELLMIGDTPYDIQAATGAKVRIIALLSGGWRIEELAGAAGIYDHPADLLEWYDPVFLCKEII